MDAVVAVYENWGIGKNGTQPITLSVDRRHFRELTGSSALILGRRTLEDFPDGKPLKGRTNIVLSTRNIHIEGAIVVHSLQEALDAVEGLDKVYVIGGAQVYREFLPHCERIYLTRIFRSPDCDVFFPDLDALPGWQCLEEGPIQEWEGIAYRFQTYGRV